MKSILSILLLLCLTFPLRADVTGPIAALVRLNASAYGTYRMDASGKILTQYHAVNNGKVTTQQAYQATTHIIANGNVQYMSYSQMIYLLELWAGSKFTP